jgi:hypothetical protein
MRPKYGSLTVHLEASALSSLSLSRSERKDWLDGDGQLSLSKKYFRFHLDRVSFQPFVKLIHFPVFGTRTIAFPLRMGRVITAGYLFFKHFSIGLCVFLFEDREWGLVDVQKVITVIIFQSNTEYHKALKRSTFEMQNKSVGVSVAAETSVT